jgi:hypothetical protein
MSVVRGTVLKSLSGRLWRWVSFPAAERIAVRRAHQVQAQDSLERGQRRGPWQGAYRPV